MRITSVVVAFFCMALVCGLVAVAVREWRQGKKVSAALTVLHALAGVAIALWWVG